MIRPRYLIPVTLGLFVSLLSVRASAQTTHPAATQGFPLPPVMHFCNQHCLTLNLVDGKYVVTPASYGVAGAHSVWLIERFTRSSVVFHRTDTINGRLVFRATIAGSISPDGERLDNGTSDGARCCVRIVWGKALNSLPGKDTAAMKAQWQQQSMSALWLKLGQMYQDPHENETLGQRASRLSREASQAEQQCSDEDPSGTHDLDICAKARDLRSESNSAGGDYDHSYDSTCNLLKQARAACNNGNGNQDACAYFNRSKKEAAQHGCAL